MRSALLVSAFFGLALAIPRPQEMDWEEIDSAPQPSETGPSPAAVSDPVDYNPEVAASDAAAATEADLEDPSKHKVRRTVDVNAPCAPQPDGYGPKPPVDTVDAFYAYDVFKQTSENTPCPQGYHQTFQNLQGSSNANSYMGLYTLKTYDVYKCQQLCDAVDQCTAFNIYYERDPSVNPADSCPNPPSFTNIKCTLWGSNVTPESAVNKGQYRKNFHVVITGSNGCVKDNPPSPCSGFDGPSKFSCAINAPLTPEGKNTYIGVKYFPGIYDAGKCAAACTTNTAYNARHPRADGTYDPCNFFNAYYLEIDNVPDGTYCSLYTQPWSKEYATNCGQYRGPKHYTVTSSYGFSANPQDSGRK